MIELGTVVLNTKHLQGQKNFYQHIIGLSVLKEEDNKVELGIKGNEEPLITLLSTNLPKGHHYGLYHLAILVPSRKDLGDALLHILKAQAPLQGASNHGYSEAIYLADLEGNGIEIYHDRPKSAWNYQGDQIIGITEEMDAEGVLALAEDKRTYFMPEGTKMGHVHLSVENPLASQVFFKSMLNMDEKFSMKDQATWLANGDYHHHIAANKWAGVLNKIQDIHTPGLNHFVVKVKDETDWHRFLEATETHPEYIVNQSAKEYFIKDNNGIHMLVRQDYQ